MGTVAGIEWINCIPLFGFHKICNCSPPDAIELLIRPQPHPEIEYYWPFYLLYIIVFIFILGFLVF